MLDFGDEIVIVFVKKNVDFMGILKFDKFFKDVMREVREEEWELEVRKWGE